jgi:membrane protein implicated in regulation of membrane protease activity
MAAYLVWAIAGFILIIAELLTGTLYLLVIGIALLVGALVGFLGGDFWLQCILSGATALLGIYLAHSWRQKHQSGSTAVSNSLEIGQTVVFESWVDQATGTARVKYRGASWDARVAGTPNPNDVLKITAIDQGVLQVAP